MPAKLTPNQTATPDESVWVVVPGPFSRLKVTGWPANGLPSTWSDALMIAPPLNTAVADDTVSVVGCTTPVPWSWNVWLPPAALYLKAMPAVRVPAAAAVNEPIAIQYEPAGSEPPFMEQ